jgi:hypothetical protein
MKKTLSLKNAIGILILFCLLLYILPTVTTSPKEKKQQELAKELGVEIKDYPPIVSFPSGYFSDVLKPGMSIAEVHSIVIGYKMALRCGETQEKYYFLTVDEKDSERFWLFYDQEGKFERKQSEGDSGRLAQGHCSIGLLDE